MKRILKESRNEHGQTSLIIAARDGDNSQVEILLGKGEDTRAKDDYGCTALMRAAMAGHKSTALILIKHGAEINAKGKDGNTALTYAISCRNEDMVRLLVENGASIHLTDDNGSTPLISAIIYDCRGIISLLLDNDTINKADNNGTTPLMWAAINQNKDIALTFINRGAEIEAKSKDGSTALMWATCRREIHIVQTLINKRAKVNTQDNEGNTALMRAVEEGEYEIAKVLLKAGADINTTRNIGNFTTALHIILSKISPHPIENNFKILELLLENGADISMPDGIGRTIFDKANTNSKIKDILLKKIPVILGNLKLVEIKEGDNESIQKNKIITSLLYESQRHKLEDEPCKTLINILRFTLNEYNLQHYIQNGKIIREFTKSNSTFISELQKFIVNEETKNTDFYGSYLSDDSDSEHEDEVNEYDNIRTQITPALKKAYQESFLRKIRDNSNAEFKFDDLKKSVRDRQQISYPSIIDKNKIQEVLNKINELITNGSTIKQALEEIKNNLKLQNIKFFIAQYRGINYNTTKWNKPARGAHRKEDEVGRPYYSASILFGASQTNNFAELYKCKSTLTPEETIKLSRAFEIWNNALKDKLLAARKTGKYAYNCYIYNNLAELLQDLYTKDYDNFTSLATNNLILKQYLLNNHNPFVSTGDVPYHALKYAYGIKIYEVHKDERLRPRWRKNGKAERPYSGKVYLSLHPLEDYSENGALHVVSLNAQGRVNINNIIVSEREASFPASIPAERIIEIHIAKYPSFHRGYKDFYLEKYGLTRTMYRELRDKFKTLKPHTPGMERFKQILGEWLCSYHEVKMVELARKKAEELYGVLIYRGLDGLFTMQLPSDTPMRKASDMKNKTEAARMVRGNSASHNGREIREKVIREISDREGNFEQKGAYTYEQFIRLVENNKLSELRSSIFPSCYYWTSCLYSNKLTTALHIAVNKQNLLIVEYLLQNRAFLDVRDSEGKTPLHLAVINKDIKIIDCLVKHGANNRIPDNSNKTPFDLAREIGDKELEDSLLNFEEQRTKSRKSNNEQLSRSEIDKILEEIQKNKFLKTLFNKAREDTEDNTVVDLINKFDSKQPIEQIEILAKLCGYYGDFKALLAITNISNLTNKIKCFAISGAITWLQTHLSKEEGNNLEATEQYSILESYGITNEVINKALNSSLFSSQAKGKERNRER
ncbi:ankyrin repeat domain-containing protein [Candidatus Jidaibacter acanthamoebae]|nr:ankyrin repeat domain-containing protein [Candidatus Jidaibacter acanthamoeba]